MCPDPYFCTSSHRLLMCCFCDIGLGDFYIAPEEMFIGDLLVYTLLFLFGFVLLSSFLTELAYLLGGLFPDISTELAKRLKFVGILPCEGRLKGPRQSSVPDFALSNSVEPEIPVLPEDLIQH
jgi:hypothetical protein